MSAVEWKKLGDVCKVHTGEQLNRNDMVDDGQFPVINGGKEPSGYTNSFNEQANSITISQGGESAGFVNWIDKDFWAGSHCFVVEENENIVKKFLYYSLKNIEIILQSTKQGAGIPGLNRKKLYEQIIPIPSLARQQEIVSHLDTFTTLISNLESELDMRSKQYEHYRNQLLDFEGVEGVEWKTLGEVCDFIRGPFGGALKKDMFVKEGYAIYEQQHAIYGDWIFRYFINDDKFHQMKRFEVKAGEILMSCSGTMGKTSIVPENPIKGIINQALLKLSVKEIATNKFVKAFMDSSWFQKGLSQNTSGGAIQNVASVSILKTLEIPVPSLKTQQEIVSELDAFENLIQSLEQEIKLRKQQYEYYREKLLTFE